MTRAQLDQLFKSLAHSDRRAVLTVLMKEPGLTVNELAGQLKISRYALMKHLKLLEDAGLVRPKRNGRNKELHFRSGPIQRLMSGWLAVHSTSEAEEVEAATAAEDLSTELSRLLGSGTRDYPVEAPVEPLAEPSVREVRETSAGSVAAVESAVPESAVPDEPVAAEPPPPAPRPEPVADPLSWMLG